MLSLSVAIEEDIAELCHLLSLLFEQEAEFSPNPEAQRAGLLRIMANPEVGAILVAKQDGKLVGMVNVLFTVSTALGASVAWLEDMVVLPSARGAGMGSSLLQYALDFAKQRNVKRVTLLTDHDNVGAQTFYAKHGFRVSTMIPMRVFLD